MKTRGESCYALSVALSMSQLCKRAVESGYVTTVTRPSKIPRHPHPTLTHFLSFRISRLATCPYCPEDHPEVRFQQLTLLHLKKFD